MMYNELGSEFWLQDISSEGETYALSGRTAIDLIIQDLLVSGKSVKSVYMPAWCCESMLQPFIDRAVKIKFYDVSAESEGLGFHIDGEDDVDIFYVTNYFGYDSKLKVDEVSRFKEQGATVLYDRTHSLFMEHDEMKNVADYTFASVRKWLGVPCGAYLSKTQDKLILPPLKECPYLDEKIEAMQMKAAYMQGDASIDKQQFLNLYGSFGHHLGKDYRNYKMDSLSRNIWRYTDKRTQERVRCANAVQFHTCLKEVPQIHLIFNMSEGDCPLFVPVLLESKEERDALRKYLTTHAIYCPIHWPKPEIIPLDMQANELYDRELSLLCDQRYGLDDMMHIVNNIKEFYKQTKI